MGMKHSNCIVVFNRKKDEVLFCRRKKDPYKGLYNFVGGKVEPGEASEDAAYRELEEETGISRRDICLYRLMDLTYYHLNFVLEIYLGVLEQDMELKEEVNPLKWLPVKEDFTDKKRFAGDQNIAHIINIALQFPVPDCKLNANGRFIGVDGCKSGWVAAIIEDGLLHVKCFSSIDQIVEAYPVFDSFLIDMAIGLQESAGDVRPDHLARKRLANRSSTVFPQPARQAVYAEGEEMQKKANLAVLGKSLAKQSMALIPKIREVDEFLDQHREYKNVICESHPELCFAGLKGEVLKSQKKEDNGFQERMDILSKFLGKENTDSLYGKSKLQGCHRDDILDAVCLAVTAMLKAQGLCRTVPREPYKDARGLFMQMIVPVIRGDLQNDGDYRYLRLREEETSYGKADL